MNDTKALAPSDQLAQVIAQWKEMRDVARSKLLGPQSDHREYLDAVACVSDDCAQDVEPLLPLIRAGEAVVTTCAACGLRFSGSWTDCPGCTAEAAALAVSEAQQELHAIREALETHKQWVREVIHIAESRSRASWSVKDDTTKLRELAALVGETESR